MFEYKYLVLDMNGDKNKESAENILNQLGQEKWEVINFDNLAGNCINVMLKRAI